MGKQLRFYFLAILALALACGPQPTQAVAVPDHAYQVVRSQFWHGEGVANFYEMQTIVASDGECFLYIRDGYRGGLVKVEPVLCG